MWHLPPDSRGDLGGRAADVSRDQRIAGVLLAAGEGRRFGGPKALATIEGELLVDRGVQLMVAAGCDVQIVVLGATADQVQAAASLGGCDVVVASDWSTGMAASLRAGLDAAVAAGVGAVVITLVDQPWIEPAAIRRLVTAWRSGAIVAVAAYDGERRHPVLLDASIVSNVAPSLQGDRGARDWLDAHPDIVVAVDCSGIGSAADVDLPTDLP